ncbi:MAG: hypothetical protein IKR76_07065 [Ruminococcus sp.]|nr:hypothetical protein [Ruminococcus sp.]
MFFKKKPEDVQDDIIVVKKPAPNTCGGTYATQRKNAPTEIQSQEMTLFSADSSFTTMVVDINAGEQRVDYICAFAAPAMEGTFLYLYKRYRFTDTKPETAFVKENVMPKLTQLVNEQGMAKGNGYHSNTAGLPENFGGSVDIRYASGEQISFSNNQCPIISYETGQKIIEVFESAMQGERISLPDVADIVRIRFDEQRKNGGFTKAELTINADGTGINKKQSRYDDPKVFESEKPVEPEVVESIRQYIAACGMLAWGSMPCSEFPLNDNKHLTFVLKDGTEITVNDSRLLPGAINSGFFNIELEMTTKH